MAACRSSRSRTLTVEWVLREWCRWCRAKCPTMTLICLLHSSFQYKRCSYETMYICYFIGEQYWAVCEWMAITELLWLLLPICCDLLQVMQKLCSFIITFSAADSNNNCCCYRLGTLKSISNIYHVDGGVNSYLTSCNSLSRSTLVPAKVRPQSNPILPVPTKVCPHPHPCRKINFSDHCCTSVHI